MQNLIFNGFETVKDIVADVNFVNYKKNLCDLIRVQIKRTPQQGLVQDAKETTILTHAMNANIGIMAYRAARGHI